jgi:plastocyanin
VASEAKEESMRVVRILAVVAIAATFGLAAGCGGDDDDDDDTAAPEATTTEEEAAGGGGGGASTVGMTEYAFDPSDLTASQGDTITATNDGELPHNYTIEANGDEVTSGDVDPGSSGELTVDVDPGDYDVICTIPGHAEQGMTGTITVE